MSDIVERRREFLIQVDAIFVLLTPSEQDDVLFGRAVLSSYCGTPILNYACIKAGKEAKGLTSGGEAPQIAQDQ